MRSGTATLLTLILCTTTATAAVVTCPALQPRIGYSLSPSSCESGLQAKNTQCTYSCSADGMIGNSTYKCTSTGQWSGALPNCQRAACPMILTAAHGQPGPCGGTKFTGDTCNPTCDNGYSPSSDTGFTCVGRPNGTASWDAIPTCVKTTCPPLAGPTHGAISTCITLSGTTAVPESGSGPTARYATNTICFINCNAGYSTNGVAALCSIVGPGIANWAGGQRCVPNSCSILPNDETRGTNSYTSSCWFGQTASAGFCTLSCDTWGYTGSVVRTCTTGTWSLPAVPTCTPVNCTTTPALDNILNGTCVPTLLGAQCTPTCASLYVYVGDAYTCMGEGSDDVTLLPPPPSGLAPQCVLQACPAIPQNPPYTAGCPETASGHSCLLTCSPGQIPFGGVPIVLNCLLGSWEYPSCVECVVDACEVDALRASLGLQAYNVSCSTETVGGEVNIAATCNVSCANGYGGSYPAVAICGSNGIFTGPGAELSCTAITCPPLAEGCGTSLGSVCSLDGCDPGYVITGSVPVCDRGQDPASAVGVWTGPLQTCTAVPCEPLLDDPSAGCSTDLGATCYANCSSGYAASGTAPTCVGTGVGTSDWSGPAQTCVAVDCNQLGGYSGGCNITLGSVCYASCPGDDVISGSAPECVGQAPGVSAWSGPAQTCTLSSCQSFEDAASMGCSNLPESFCMAACDAGYCVSGSAPECVVVSPHVLAWTGPAQTCTPAECEPLLAAGSSGCSVQLGSTCYASCNDGYTTDGEAPQCAANGTCSATWSGAAQTCTPVACAAFDSDTSGGCDADLGATCYATCPSGYAPSGEAPVCLGTGAGQSTWSGPEQTCVPVNCTSLGGYSANCSTALGSTCEAACPDINDAAAGEAPMCVGDGEGASSWTGPPQTCPLSACPSFNSSASIGCSNFPGSTCEADCGDGYCSVGTPPTCIALSPHVLGWSGEAQTCSPANCPTLLDSASSECGAHLEDTCYASCPDGYAAMGTAPTCTADGPCAASWSGPAQTCEPVPCDTSDFGESGANCSDALNSVCYAICPEGYVANGAAPQCLASGPGTSAWSGPGQSCDPVPCPPFTDPASANCSTSLGASCSASCPAGYSADGMAPQCMASGPAASAWSGPAQACLPVACEPLSTDGSTDCPTTLDATCYASCENGYAAAGTAPTCTGTGVGASDWSGPAQTCVAVSCVSLGGYSSSCNASLGSTCFAACPDEDVVSGDPPTCVGEDVGMSGWSGPAQTCNQSSCPSFENYASAGCTNLADSICDASCNAGYCATGSVPECIVTSPHVLEWTAAEQTCSPTSCGPIAESGPAAGCSYYLGAVCEISCPDGYTVTGAVPECVGVSVCLSGWSDDAQTCEPMSCEQFTGTSSDCSTDLGSLCFASCPDGYWASGPTPVCTATGPGTSAWSDAAQTCLPVSCTTSGQYSGCASADLGSTCYTNCSDGYLLVGTAPECQASGPGASAWSGSAQTCNPVSCPAFNEQSSVNCNTTLGSLCAGSCPNGYQITGAIPQCLGTGPAASAWSGPARDCVPVDCSHFVNSTGSSCNVALGTVCFASCADGYYASGAAPRCVGSGQGTSAWSGPAQTCKPAPCEAFTDQYNSNCHDGLGDTCHASCPSGYSTVGTAPQCVAAGPADSEWTGPAQTCVPVSCPPFMDGTSNGCNASLGSTCFASCADGYSPSGTAPQCLGTGPSASAWSGPAQTCVSVPCVGFGAGTSVDCDTALGSTCYASCPSGYAAPDEIAPTCVGTGVGTSAWSGPAQTCEPVDCVHLGGYSSNCSTSLGSTCNAACPNIDTVSGSAPTCVGDGPGASVWSGPAQTCTGSACQSFNSTQSANCSSLPDSTCVATCNCGYCQSGAAPECVVISPHVLGWSGPEQTCVAVDCAPLNGSSSDCGTALGTVCAASCSDGYQVSGLPPECVGTDQCESSWSDPAQTCNPVSCTGFLDSSSGGCDVSLGSVCYASCPDGYQAAGAAPQCVGTAPGASAWSGPEQTCTPVDCPAFTGYSANCSTALGEFCDADCPDGYLATGPAPQCAEDGPAASAWSGPAQTCAPVSCEAFVNSSSGCSTALGATCSASCPDGYSATGAAPQCVASGPGTSDWSGPAQTCTPVPCPAFTDGTSDNCSTSLGSTCDASCADGYSIGGAAPTCSGTGPGASAWSGPAQTCDPVSCTAFTDGTSNNCSTDLGSICSAICPSNSVAVGDAPECVGTGAGASAWSGPAQTCNVVCTAVTSAPSNGDVGTCGQVLTPGQNCSISCNSGYMIAGDSELTCGQGGGSLEGSQMCGVSGTCWNSLPDFPVSMGDFLISPGLKATLSPGSSQNATCTQMAVDTGVADVEVRMYAVSNSGSVFNYTLFCDVVYPPSQCLQTCCPANATSPLVEQYPYLATVNHGGLFTEKLLSLATNTIMTTTSGFCCAGEWRPRYSPVNVDGSYAYLPCINNLPQANDPSYATVCPG